MNLNSSSREDPRFIALIESIIQRMTEQERMALLRVSVVRAMDSSEWDWHGHDRMFHDLIRDKCKAILTELIEDSEILKALREKVRTDALNAIEKLDTESVLGLFKKPYLNY